MKSLRLRRWMIGVSVVQILGALLGEFADL